MANNRGVCACVMFGTHSVLMVSTHGVYVRGDLFGAAAHERLERLQTVLPQLVVVPDAAEVDDERHDALQVLPDPVPRRAPGKRQNTSAPAACAHHVVYSRLTRITSSL